jgi:hypothetical protein
MAAVRDEIEAIAVTDPDLPRTANELNSLGISLSLSDVPYQLNP